ncbi:hypothetical protein Pelo_11950 [Pelomyxa schiedti]|nr:hypothetical protein Pelo_11950 [Pelomyxa schiedti]
MLRCSRGTKVMIALWDFFYFHRNQKMCLSVLLGFLCGGHVDLAEKLVASGGLGSSERPLFRAVRWPGAPGSNEDMDMKESIRASGISSFHQLFGFGETDPFMIHLCRDIDTKVGAVKWVIEWAGTREPWEVFQLVTTAMRAGNAEVTQWLVTTFNLEEKTRDLRIGLGGICGCMEMGRCPMLIRWWTETFSFPPGETRDSNVLGFTVSNPHSSVELCQWVMRNRGLTDLQRFFLQEAQNPHTFRWAIEEFHIVPMEEHLNNACEMMGDLEVAKWLVTNQSVRPTHETVLNARSSRRENVELVKWLSTLVALTPANLQKALGRSLHRGNTAIAEWLESNFHVVSLVQSTPGCYGATLLEACQSGREELVKSLNWLLKHMGETRVEGITIEQCIKKATSAKALLLLLQNFPCHSLQEDRRSALLIRHVPGGLPLQYPLLIHLLDSFILNGDVSDIQALYSLVHFTVDDVLICINRHSSITASSSKVVKWLVLRFGAVNFNNKISPLIHNLLFSSPCKAHCAEWLIDTLGVPLTEILKVKTHSVISVGLSTWKRIVDKNPSVFCTADTVRKLCMHIVTSSAAIAHWSMHRWSLSHEEICQLWCREAPLGIAPDMQLWEKFGGNRN